MTKLKIYYTETSNNGNILVNNKAEIIEISNYKERETEDILDELAYTLQSETWSNVEIHNIIPQYY